MKAWKGPMEEMDETDLTEDAPIYYINLYCMSILCMDRSWGVDFAFVVSESK